MPTDRPVSARSNFGQMDANSQAKSQLGKNKKSIKKTITKLHTFKINDRFRSNLKRITINSI